MTEEFHISLIYHLFASFDSIYFTTFNITIPKYNMLFTVNNNNYRFHKTFKFLLNREKDRVNLFQEGILTNKNVNCLQVYFQIFQILSCLSRQLHPQPEMKKSRILCQPCEVWKIMQKCVKYNLMDFSGRRDKSSCYWRLLLDPLEHFYFNSQGSEWCKHNTNIIHRNVLCYLIYLFHRQNLGNIKLQHVFNSIFQSYNWARAGRASTLNRTELLRNHN